MLSISNAHIYGRIVANCQVSLIRSFDVIHMYMYCIYVVESSLKFLRERIFAYFVAITVPTIRLALKILSCIVS